MRDVIGFYLLREARPVLASELETLIDVQAIQRHDPEDRYQTTGVTWRQYLELLDQLGDRPGFRVTYLDGVLEIVAPSLRHEDVKSRIGDLLPIYFLETDTEYYPKGSTTFRQQERRGGTEADESYGIGTDKAIPDLAIEVVITSGGLNRLEVYHRLGVPEVWFWQNDRFSLYHLREETPAAFIPTFGYEAISQSELLPYLKIERFAEYVLHPHPLTAAKTFRQHLQENLNRS
jgi:Uma2 family endonuclease